MRKLVLMNFPGHFWEPKVVGQFRKGDRFCLLVWSKPELWGLDFGPRTLFMVHCHPLNCIYGSEIGLIEFVHPLRGGWRVEMGAWSWLGLETEIVNFSSQAKKQQMKFSKPCKTLWMLSLIHRQKIYLSVDGYLALHWKWNSLKLSQPEHLKMEVLKLQVTFKSYQFAGIM